MLSPFFQDPFTPALSQAYIALTPLFLSAGPGFLSFGTVLKMSAGIARCSLGVKVCPYSEPVLHTCSLRVGKCGLSPYKPGRKLSLILLVATPHLLTTEIDFQDFSSSH